MPKRKVKSDLLAFLVKDKKNGVCVLLFAEHLGYVRAGWV